MIYSYSISGIETGTQNNLVIDTASPEFRARCNWVAKKLGSMLGDVPAWSERSYLVSDPLGNVRKQCAVEFNAIKGSQGLPQGEAPSADAFLVYRSPKTAVVSIVFELGLPIDVSALGEGPTDNETPAVIQDWDLPGSPIGPPLASLPGHFQFRWTGHQPGDVVVGGSGKRYKLVLHGQFWGRIYAWQPV